MHGGKKGVVVVVVVVVYHRYPNVNPPIGQKLKHHGPLRRKHVRILPGALLLHLARARRRAGIIARRRAVGVHHASCGMGRRAKLVWFLEHGAFALALALGRLLRGGGGGLEAAEDARVVVQGCVGDGDASGEEEGGDGGGGHGGGRPSPVKLDAIEYADALDV